MFWWYNSKITSAYDRTPGKQLKIRYLGAVASWRGGVYHLGRW